MKFLSRLRKIEDREDKLQRDKDSLLRDYGWECSSDYPAPYWLWSKTFQGYAINGTTLEIALKIEAAWQDLYTTNPT